MHTARAETLGFAALVGSAVVLAATSTASAGVGAHPTSTRMPAHSSHHTTVSTRHDHWGTYLVDSKGRTLYLFKKDDSGESHCAGSCASEWPPLMAKGSPHASGHAKQGMLGTTMRSNGEEQVTYNGHPLYRFAGDTSKGDTSGQGLEEFGAKWFLVNSHGKKIDDHGGHGGGW